jgi:hypothetical protein
MADERRRREVRIRRRNLRTPTTLAEVADYAVWILAKLARGGLSPDEGRALVAACSLAKEALEAGEAERLRARIAELKAERSTSPGTEAPIALDPPTMDDK